jgi:hypothetical protein
MIPAPIAGEPITLEQAQQMMGQMLGAYTPMILEVVRQLRASGQL